jgi:chorismate mutase
MNAMDLDTLREQIDESDRQLFLVLAQRFALIREVGRFKREYGIAMLQPQREAEITEQFQERARELGLSETFGQRLIALILGEAHRLENEIINQP